MSYPRALLGVAAILLGGLCLGAPAHADSIGSQVVKVGWWSQQPGAQAQPNGGFQIALNPQGPQSVAAVEVSVDAASSATTTITLVEGTSVRSDSAALQVCATISGWGADNPGAFTAAPPSDCSTQVALQRDASGPTWSADVSSLVQPGQTSDLEILPVAQPVSGLVDPGFQVTITGVTVKADGTSSTTDTSSSTASSGGSPSPSDSASSPSSPSSNFTSSASSQSSTGIGSFAGTSQAQAPAAPVAAAAAPATPAAAPAQAPASGALGQPNYISGVVHHHGGSKPWGRLLIFIPLAAIVGFTAAMAKKYAGQWPLSAGANSR